MKFIKKIRTGKDLSISWPILTNGEAQSLADRALRLELVSPTGKAEVLAHITDGNTIRADISAAHLKRSGTYSLRLWENYGQSGQSVVDTDAFIIVPRSRDEQLAPPRCPHHHADGSPSAPDAEGAQAPTEADPSGLSLTALQLTPENLTIGDKGADGVGIAKIEQITHDLTPAAPNTIRVTLTDGTHHDFQIYNGDTRMLTAREWPATGIPVDNTKYHLGTIAALHIAALPDVNEDGIIIYFTAAPGCTLTYPAGTPWMGEYAPAITPGRQYLITITDGICSINQINHY